MPGHFPSDAHGLARFDGTALYEHEDPRRGFHKDWNTLIYNYGRREVANFLESNAHFWLDQFPYRRPARRCRRLDALPRLQPQAGRVGAERHGGRENLEAIDFLRRMNTSGLSATIPASSPSPRNRPPGRRSRARSTAAASASATSGTWAGCTTRSNTSSRIPIHRRYHHDKLTFGLLYAWDENFILPISHDEVVHGKGSLLGKMPGDRWQKFANLRAYLGFMWTHPGKKLLFMGCEFAQEREWKHDHSLDWHLLADPGHRGIQSLVRDLNALYRSVPALHQLDCEPAGFEWIDGGNADDSVLALPAQGRRRRAAGAGRLPISRRSCATDIRVGVPGGGRWTERLNTDAALYGGSNVGNGGRRRGRERADARARRTRCR